MKVFNVEFRGDEGEPDAGGRMRARYQDPVMVTGLNVVHAVTMGVELGLFRLENVTSVRYVGPVHGPIAAPEMGLDD